jgi:hypothetical protein
VPPIDAIIRAWRLSADLHTLRPGADDAALRAAEESLGRPLPAALAALYRFSDGADLLGGNLTLLPLHGDEDSLGLDNASDAYRASHWPVPQEVLIFGGNGQDEAFGLWLPETADPAYDHPVVQIGELFEPACMAVYGTSLVRFLAAWSAYYLLLEEAPARALRALGVPRALRAEESADDYGAFAAWADPGLPDPAPDVYETAYDVEGLRRLFGA